MIFDNREKATNKNNLHCLCVESLSKPYQQCYQLHSLEINTAVNFGMANEKDLFELVSQ